MPIEVDYSMVIAIVLLLIIAGIVLLRYANRREETNLEERQSPTGRQVFF